jgi:hypothetical protein
MKPRHTSQAGPARIALRAALMLVLLAGCTPTAPSANTSPSTPIQTTATSATSSPSASPIDTTNWTVYESKQYGFSIKHPPGWEVLPAERDWTLKDAGQEGGGGQETFVTPADDLYVAVWSAPAKDTPETPEGVAAWVEQYCKLAGKSCSGLDRSVPLCNGAESTLKTFLEDFYCDPGLLVTVDGDFVEAFFTGGKHKGRMIAVEVGLPESAAPVAEYGGARRLLEDFLSGMGVCPAQPDQSQTGCP